MRLKIGNASNCEVNVVPPPGNDWVWVNSSMASGFEECQERLPHLVFQLLSLHRETSNNGVSDESVWIFGRVPACCPVFVSSPESSTCDRARLAGMPGLVPERNFDLAKGQSVPLQPPLWPIGLEINVGIYPGVLKGECFPVELGCRTGNGLSKTTGSL